MELPPPRNKGTGSEQENVMKKPAAKAAVPKSVAKSAPKVKASAKKTAAKAAAKTRTAKDTTTIKCGKGWLVEVRARDSGQKDKHYQSPDGKWYRILGHATKAGFPGEP